MSRSAYDILNEVLLTDEQIREAAAYNRRSLGHHWLPDDLPSSAAKDIVQAADLNEDGDLTGEEPGHVNWHDFSLSVAMLQKLGGLNEVDGKLGPMTAAYLRCRKSPEIALKTLLGAHFCRPIIWDCRPNKEIYARGLADPAHRRAGSVWNRYGGALTEICREIGLPVAVAVGVFMVEAGGQAYDPQTGLVIIRVETPDRFKDRSKTFQRLYGSGQAAEWRALEEWLFECRKETTREADRPLRRTSWGLPQIMGFNARFAGYPNAVAMATSFQASALCQIKAFFQVCESFNVLFALKSENWKEFARSYNGPGQVEHYAGAIDEAVRVARTILEDVVE